MRPRTLSEAYERLLAGEQIEPVYAGLLDTFYGAKDAEARLACLADEPPLTGDPRLDALAGACAEYLAKLYRLPAVPSWTAGAKRRLSEPWFTSSVDDAAMRSYLVYASPAEFRSRNIFTEERPLRRASSATAALAEERRAPLMKSAADPI
jgi:hypothetical protein